MVVTCFLKGGNVVQASLTVTKRLVCCCRVVQTTLILSCSREWCTRTTVRSVTTVRLLLEFGTGTVTSRTTMWPRIFTHILSTTTMKINTHNTRVTFFSDKVYFVQKRGKCQLTTKWLDVVKRTYAVQSWRHWDRPWRYITSSLKYSDSSNCKRTTNRHLYPHRHNARKLMTEPRIRNTQQTRKPTTTTTTTPNSNKWDSDGHIYFHIQILKLKYNTINNYNFAAFPFAITTLNSNPRFQTFKRITHKYAAFHTSISML